MPPTHHLVLACKRLATDAEDPADAVQRFEMANRAFLTLRDRWCHEHRIPDAAPRPPEVERYAGARILALAPHPDDEIIGCGGTLLRLARAGARVTVLQAIDGSASVALDETPPAIRRTIRLDEARAVAEAAGFESTICWSEDNREFRAHEDLVLRLRDTLLEIGPALVFTPFIADIHPDHLTLNCILARALESLPERGMRVLGYETAMKVDDFIHMCRTRNRYHALTLVGAPGYTEAYFATDVPRFREMMGRMPSRAT